MTRRPLGVAPTIVGLVMVACGGAAEAETHVSGEVGGQTWTAAGSPYVVDAPATVAEGRTLTIQAGTTVAFGAMTAVPNAFLSVAGTLVVDATPEDPAALSAPPGTSSTTAGISIDRTGVATITGAVIAGAGSGIRSWGHLTVGRSTLEDNLFAGIELAGGTAAIDAVLARNDGSGIFVQLTDGVTITNTIVLGAKVNGIAVNQRVSVSIVNCTIDGSQDGVWVYTGNVEIRNTIVSNGHVGIRNPAPSSGGTVTIINSDVFGNRSANFDGVTPGADCISADPGYLGPSDRHLRADSPCIDAGAAAGAPDHDFDLMPRPAGPGFDMGAYEFRPSDGSGGAAGGGGGIGGTVGSPGAGGTSAAGAGGGTGGAGTGSGVGATGGVSGTGGWAGQGPPDGGLGRDAPGDGGARPADGCLCAPAPRAGTPPIPLVLGALIWAASRHRTLNRFPGKGARRPEKSRPGAVNGR